MTTPAESQQSYGAGERPMDGGGVAFVQHADPRLCCRACDEDGESDYPDVCCCIHGTLYGYRWEDGEVSWQWDGAEQEYTALTTDLPVGDVVTGLPQMPVGIDAAAVAQVAQPGDLWVRSNDMHWEYAEGSDGRGSLPPQPTDRPSTKFRRLVGSWRSVPRTAPFQQEQSQLQGETPDA